MKTFLSIAFCILSFPTWGQTLTPLTQIGKKQISHEELMHVYEYYVSSEFSKIAHELAKRTGNNPLLQSYVSNDELQLPWMHSLELVLSSAWQVHTDYINLKEPMGKKFEMLMQVLEGKNNGPGRRLAFQSITTRLHWGRQTSLPPLESTVDRLQKILFDTSEDDSLRSAILPVLYEHHNPNEYLDLAIKLSSKQQTPIAVAEAFRFMTPVRHSNKLSKKNRTKYLNHIFQLLADIDDKDEKRSGHGYFLAMHIGSFIGVEPVRDGQGPFAPDQRLEKYQGKYGLSDSFFQKTVENALNWWAQNEGR